MKNIIFILLLGLFINGCITINKTYYTPIKTDTIYIKENLYDWKFNPDNIHYIIPVNYNIKTTL